MGVGIDLATLIGLSAKHSVIPLALLLSPRKALLCLLEHSLASRRCLSLLDVVTLGLNAWLLQIYGVIPSADVHIIVGLHMRL